MKKIKKLACMFLVIAVIAPMLAIPADAATLSGEGSFASLPRASVSEHVGVTPFVSCCWTPFNHHELRSWWQTVGNQSYRHHGIYNNWRLWARNDGSSAIAVEVRRGGSNGSVAGRLEIRAGQSANTGIRIATINGFETRHIVSSSNANGVFSLRIGQSSRRDCGHW